MFRITYFLYGGTKRRMICINSFILYCKNKGYATVISKSTDALLCELQIYEFFLTTATFAPSARQTCIPCIICQIENLQFPKVRNCRFSIWKLADWNYQQWHIHINGQAPCRGG